MKFKLVPKGLQDHLKDLEGGKVIALAEHGDVFVSLWDGPTGRVVFTSGDTDVLCVEIDDDGIRVYALEPEDPKGESSD